VIPEHLRYTAEHEWAAAGEQTSAVRVGVTDFAQQALGDVVFVQLPEVGARVAKGDPIGEIESTKSLSEIYAPLSGAVVAVNGALADSPELVNADPYGEGWLIEIEPAGPSATADLLDAEGYRSLTEPA
jgi:glycine cleavage system H protein